MKKNKTIALIAYNLYHQDYYYELITKLYSENIKCIIFCELELSKQLQVPYSAKFYITEKKRKFFFLLKHRNVLNSCNSVIFDEPYSYDLYLYLYIPLKAKKILTIHNARQWFKPKPKSILGHLKVLNHILIVKMKFITRFIAVNYNAKKYIKKNKPKANVFFIPFGFSNSTNFIKNKSTTIKILIPGMITQKRRDYNIIQYAFSLFKSTDKLSNIELVLLGKPIDSSGFQIISEFEKSSKKKGFKLLSFNEYIPQATFNKYLNDCDFILSNSNIEIVTDYGLVETYGITKESGIVSSALRFSKPLIISEEYSIPEEYLKCTITYKTGKDLYNIINKISIGEILPHNFSKDFINAHLAYKEKIKSEFNLLLEDIKK